MEGQTHVDDQGTGNTLTLQEHDDDDNDDFLLIIILFCDLSYHVNGSRFVLESIRLNSMILLKMCFVSVLRMFEYILDI